MTVVDSLNEIFGKEGNLPLIRISNLMKLSWQGDMCNHDGARAMCWRVLLGLISSNDRYLWQGQLADMVSAYSVLRNRVMPSIDKVKDDPLSALSSGDSMSEEWSAYYKNVELINFLKGDLDRLFLTGLDDEYFQSKAKRELLTAILFIWSMEHPLISYRQGMHEILGSILYVVDCENNAWAEISPTTDPLASSFSEFNTEAYAYAIFDRIMMELSVLYDPLPVQGIENQPFVVQYCTKIQEHYLRLLDPSLAAHLEENYIQSQLYGLRWSRLLLGREFTLAGNQVFQLWDFMFASCYDAEFNSAEDLMDDSALPNVYSVLANTRIQGYKMHHNVNKRTNKTDRITYVCTPLLASLADCMLAMMIQVREKLLEGDSSIVMATLMRYPEQVSVLPVIECADMIRRGVLVRFIDSKGSVLNYNYDTMAPTSPAPDQFSRSGKTPAKNAPGSHSRQMTTPHSTFRGGTYQDMGKKMTERITQVSASISDLVQAAIAPIIDGFDDDDEDINDISVRDPLSAHKTNTHRTPVFTKSSNISSKSNLSNSDSPQYTEDSSSTKEPLSNSSSSKFDPNVDPLTGVRLQSSTTSNHPAASSSAKLSNSNIASSTPSSSQKRISSSTSGVTTTIPPYSILFDDHSTSSNTTSASKTARSGSLSLFKPREWFSSQHHHGNAQSEANGDLRISGGFNMPNLHGSGNTVHDSQQNPVPLRKKAIIAQNQTVGDRLHDLADFLAQFSGSKTESGTNGNNGGSDESGQDDACNAVAKRMRALADVLAGQYSVVDYDVKFTNRTLPTVLSTHIPTVPAMSTADALVTAASSTVVANPASEPSEFVLQDVKVNEIVEDNSTNEEPNTVPPNCLDENARQRSTESV